VICEKCKNAGVLNTAGGKDFWYCRTCKDEIGLTPVPKAVKELESNGNKKTADEYDDDLSWAAGLSDGDLQDLIDSWSDLDQDGAD